MLASLFKAKSPTALDLVNAAYAKNLKKVKHLLHYFAKHNMLPSVLNDPSLSTQAIYAAISIPDYEMSLLLIAAGTDLTYRGDDGMSPVYFAMDCAGITMARLLIWHVPEYEHIMGPNNEYIALSERIKKKERLYPTFKKIIEQTAEDSKNAKLYLYEARQYQASDKAKAANLYVKAANIYAKQIQIDAHKPKEFEYLYQYDEFALRQFYSDHNRYCLFQAYHLYQALDKEYSEILIPSPSQKTIHQTFVKQLQLIAKCLKKVDEADAYAARLQPELSRLASIAETTDPDNISDVESERRTLLPKYGLESLSPEV